PLAAAVAPLRVGEPVPPCPHQLGDGPAVAGAFDDEIGDRRNRLGMIELDAALEPPARHHRRHGDEQLVLLARGQIHVFPCSPIPPQSSQRRGDAVPRSAASSVTRSRRSAAPSAAQSRATANPFHAEPPTSPPNSPPP